MMRARTNVRRFEVAAAALAIAAVLFRPQLADALVVRGDELLYKNARTQALARYERALWIDPDNGTAADRYVFVSLQTHTPAALGLGVDTARAYLRRHPDDAAVLGDLALCMLAERRVRDARVDFERAAAILPHSGYALYAKALERALKARRS